jgi:uncharacterized repeat protein (TIGR01451 family)
VIPVVLQNRRYSNFTKRFELGVSHAIAPFTSLRHPPAKIVLVPAFAAVALLAGQASTAEATSASADLATAVTPFNVGPHAVVGATIGYRITATNTGPDAASNVIFTDTVNPSMWSRSPTKFTCVGGIQGALCGPLPATVSCSPLPAGSPGTVTCTTGSLSPGASMTINVGVHVGFYLHNQLICDTASVTSSTVDPNAGDNTARACVPVG